MTMNTITGRSAVHCVIAVVRVSSGGPSYPDASTAMPLRYRLRGRRTLAGQMRDEFLGGVVAVGGGRAVRQGARLELVFLGADRLQDVHGHQVAQLDGTLGGQAPRRRGEEAAAERVAGAGRLDELRVRDRADDDRCRASLLHPGPGRAEGDDPRLDPVQDVRVRPAGLLLDDRLLVLV